MTARLRIATWNLERPSRNGWRRPPAQLEQLRAVDADVWVLTEARCSIPLSESHPYWAHAPAHPARRPDVDERWVSIWSRYPLSDAGITPSARGSVAAVVASPMGPVAVYGTVVPWSSEPGEDGAVRAWQVHASELERQAAEWRNLTERFDAVCVAGDFNQAWQGYGYHTKVLRQRHHEVAAAAGLRCLTAGVVEDGMPVIDHILLSQDFADRTGARVGAQWGRRNQAGVRMSDHSGVAVDLGPPDG